MRKALAILVCVHLICANTVPQTRTNQKRKRSKPARVLSPKEIKELDEWLDELSQEWQPYASTEEFNLYYGTKTVRRTSSDSLRVWTRAVLKYPLTYVKKNIPDDDKERFKGYSHYLELYEIRCGSQQSRTLAFTQYRSSGEVIRSRQYKEPDWDYAIPDSVGQAMLDRVCKYWSSQK